MADKLLSMKSIIDDSGEIVRLTREEPPVHCILKVGSFSLLQDELCGQQKNYLESTEFKAGGCTWVMSMYPNGNDKEEGKDYISLYVSMIDKVIPGDVVRAQLRFLVYDQIRDNYLCIQDVRDKRFYAMKTTWGIPQFLSLAAFKDASNGFLVDDCCVFGAEVLLVEGCAQIPCLSIVEKSCNRAFTWKIGNFTELDKRLDSPNFSFDEWTWALNLYPNGAGDGKGNSLSLFLCLKNGDDLISGNKLYAKYSLSIKNQEKCEDYKIRTAFHWFTSNSSDWGYSKFLPLDKVRDSQNGLLVEDTLVVEVRVEVMFLLKDMESYNEEE